MGRSHGLRGVRSSPGLGHWRSVPSSATLARAKVITGCWLIVLVVSGVVIGLGWTWLP